jgi:predicted restriction endonuclease
VLEMLTLSESETTAPHLHLSLSHSLTYRTHGSVTERREEKQRTLHALTVYSTWFRKLVPYVLNHRCSFEITKYCMILKVKLLRSHVSVVVSIDFLYEGS